MIKNLSASDIKVMQGLFSDMEIGDKCFIREMLKAINTNASVLFNAFKRIEQLEKEVLKMKPALDIMCIKQAVKDGEIHFYVEDGKIYCANNYGECALVGNVIKSEDDNGETVRITPIR